jgi:hypothetical protein
MHMLGIGMEKEVEIFATNITNKDALALGFCVCACVRASVNERERETDSILAPLLRVMYQMHGVG